MNGTTAEDILQANRAVTETPNTNRSDVIPMASTYTPGIGESSNETSSFALRQNSSTAIGGGGRDPETGLFPSPTHAVRNQIGNNKNFATSSYDIRADNSSENYVSNEGYMSPRKSAARPFTAAPAVMIFYYYKSSITIN